MMRTEPGNFDAPVADQNRRRHQVSAEELRIEITRKSLHLLILVALPLASISPWLAIGALTVGSIIYGTSEYLRHRGIQIPIIARLTEQAARKRDGNRFVIGPLTLAAGAILTFALYDPLPARLAILALAFGDGFSSLAGKAFGRIPMPFSGGKSVEGSAVCFGLVFVTSALVTGRIGESAILALFTTIVELLPTKDWDNVIIPLTTGLIASLLF